MKNAKPGNGEMSFMPETRIKLNHLGQYYAATNCEKNPGTFSVAAYLKEPLFPDVLQQAVNDLMRRLPFLNVKMHRGFMWYYHEVLDNPPQISNEKDFPEPCSYFKNDENHLIRILYGERHFTVEVLHTVCDGRSLAAIVSALLVRYYEISGMGVSKAGIIDCDGAMHKEEAEDAYLRYADLSKSKSEKEKDAYSPKHQPAPTRLILKKINLQQIKSAAKSYGVTITEYIMAHIFNEFAEQRAKDGSKKGITINVPIDCRGFFPTKCLRPFVSHKIITMPESLGLTEMVHEVKKQFSEITPNFIRRKIGEMERLTRLGRFVPLFIKNWFIKKIGRDESAGCSTGFSNLGLIKLPKEIEGKIEMLSFALGPEPNLPYQFACVTVGDTLVLTTTTTAKDTDIVDRIGHALTR